MPARRHADMMRPASAGPHLMPLPAGARLSFRLPPQLPPSSCLASASSRLNSASLPAVWHRMACMAASGLMTNLGSPWLGFSGCCCCCCSEGSGCSRPGSSLTCWLPLLSTAAAAAVSWLGARRLPLGAGPEASGAEEPLPACCSLALGLASGAGTVTQACLPRRTSCSTSPAAHMRCSMCCCSHCRCCGSSGGGSCPAPAGSSSKDSSCHRQLSVPCRCWPAAMPPVLSASVAALPAAAALVDGWSSAAAAAPAASPPGAGCITSGSSVAAAATTAAKQASHKRQY